MELILALAIGILVGSGVWLMLRPRSYQVIIGLCLLAYGVNLFIFAMGRLYIAGRPSCPRAASSIRPPMPTRCRRRWC